MAAEGRSDDDGTPVYTRYFGLREPPFNVTPDPRFFYRNPGYEEAYATLRYGIRARQGFVVLTGEIGTGKTTLLRRLMNELAGRTEFVSLYQTTLTSDELIAVICRELRLPADGQDRVKNLELLNDFLIQQATDGGTVVLLVDEAQNLTAEVLENLRLISNLETTQQKLLQIVLVGQPELQARLQEPQLRALRQRIVLRNTLKPLRADEVKGFIEQRLRVAGARRMLFSSDAVRSIAACTGGTPRLINIVCNAALLLAYAQDARIVDGRMIREVSADLLLGTGGKRAKSAWGPWSSVRRRLGASISSMRYERKWRTAAVAALAGGVCVLTVRTDFSSANAALVGLQADLRHAYATLVAAGDGLATGVVSRRPASSTAPVADVSGEAMPSAAPAPLNVESQPRAALETSPVSPLLPPATVISATETGSLAAPRTPPANAVSAQPVPGTKSAAVLAILDGVRKLNPPDDRR